MRISESIALYERLIALQTTAPREALYGAALKRLALIEIAADGKAAARTAVEGMAEHYKRSAMQAELNEPDGFFYVGLNAVRAMVWLNGIDRRKEGLPEDLLTSLRRTIASRNAAEPDFWSVAGASELELCVAIANGRLSSTLTRLTAAFRDLHNRAATPQLWRSVLDEATFVLTPFVRGAWANKERQAALKLLDLLERYASVDGGSPKRNRPRKSPRPTRRKRT
jgi:hypothetical protein